jgi:hypothetical protein
MDADTVLVWSDTDRRAADILRDLMRETPYPWVWRKLHSARWHLIETHTERVPYSLSVEHGIVRNADAYMEGR